jgi:hypothetical protein
MPVATKAVKLNQMKPMVDPDVDGCRFCRHCKKRLPISAFPAGARRYICRRHLYELFTHPAKLRVQADDKRRVLSKLWARCSADAKSLSQTRIQLDQREIAEILKVKGIDLAFAIVPADASRILSRENFVVVVNEARRDLISAYKKGGVHMYLSVLSAWRAADSSQEQSTEELDTFQIEEERGTV